MVSRFCPVRIGFQRAGNSVHHHIFRQDNRQPIFRRRHDDTIFKRHHRNWRAPVALAGNPPIAQAIVHLALADALRHQRIGNGIEARLEVQTIKFTGIEQNAFFGHRLSAEIRLTTVGITDNRFHRQVIFAGELKITLVMSRHRHDRTRAVIHQHKIGDPDGQHFAGQRMHHMQAGGHALFIHRGHVRFRHFSGAALLNKVGQGWIGRRRLQRKRMTRRYRDIDCAHESVRARGVDRQRLFAVCDFERNFYPFRAADPVALHGFHLLGPTLQLVQIVQERVSVGGNLHKPLRYFLALDLGVTAPAAAVDDLFIGQHRLILRAPIDRGSLFIHQPLLIQAGEKPLLPAVIVRAAGGDFTAPVIAEAQQFELVLHVIDIGVGPRRRRGVVFHRGPFGG